MNDCMHESTILIHKIQSEREMKKTCSTLLESVFVGVGPLVAENQACSVLKCVHRGEYTAFTGFQRALLKRLKRSQRLNTHLLFVNRSCG